MELEVWDRRMDRVASRTCVATPMENWVRCAILQILGLESVSVFWHSLVDVSQVLHSSQWIYSLSPGSESALFVWYSLVDVSGGSISV